MAEFLVQHDQTSVVVAGSTASITAVRSLSRAFAMMSNNRSMSGGPPASATTQASDDMALAVELTAVGTLTYSRVAASSTNPMLAEASVVEYLGDPGGPNEFIVRSRVAVNINTAVTSKTGTLTGVVDIDKCIPFITGIKSESSTAGGARATAYAIVDSTTQITVYVGGSASRVSVQVVVVEFTGSAWSVGHGLLASTTADSGTIALVAEADGDAAGTSFDVGDWATACIFGQHRGDVASDDNQAIADNYPIYYPGAGTTDVDFLFHADHDGVTNIQVVHVLQHADMAVQRMSSTASHTGVSDVAIPTAISSVDEAFVIISRTTSGTGTAYGRGWVCARLTSTTNVEMYCHRNGVTIATRIQVVDLSGIVAAAAVRRIFIV